MSMNYDQLFENFSGAFESVVRKPYTDVFPDLMLGEMKGPVRQRISRDSRFVQDGMKAIITFDTQNSYGVAPMPRFGSTPSGGTSGGLETNLTLLRWAAATQWELEDLKSANQNNSLVRNLMTRKLSALPKAWAAFDKVLLLGPESGQIGECYSRSGTTITLRNSGNTSSGLEYDSPKDANRLFSDNMFVQFYTTADVPVGEPVFINYIEYLSPTIGISAVPTGLPDSTSCDGYKIVPCDALGLTNGINLFGPSIYDAINEDNTFQGVDRSSNPRFNAYKQAASGSGEINYSQLSTFFRLLSGRLGNKPPTQAFTPWEVMDRYFQVAFRGQFMWTNPKTNTGYEDGWATIKIDRTTLVQDDEMPMTQIVVPDFPQLTLQQAGYPTTVDGVKRIPGKLIMDYVELYYGILAMLNPRTSGRLTGLSLTA